MTDFFNSEERIKRLEVHARLWIGTPWRENSRVCQVGVSCHNLPREIYVACGHLPESFPSVISSPARSKHDTIGVMKPFLDQRPEFRSLNLDAEQLQPGDLLGLRICSCVDHLGILLTGNDFVHVLMHKKTSFDGALIPPWSQRLLEVWRPIE